MKGAWDDRRQCEVQAVPLQRTLARIEAEFRPVAERKGLRFAMHTSLPDVAVRSDPALLDRMVRKQAARAAAAPAPWPAAMKRCGSFA